MESMIALATVLFILSMINERIVNFIKLQYSNKSMFSIQLGNLKDKKGDNEEDQRNKRIILLNIIVGTIVSLLMRADLISMISNIDQPSLGIGWKNFAVDKVVGWITLIPGCFLTGSFLSLGSKFWHDLLDLLLYTKDLKGSLAKQVSDGTNANVTDEASIKEAADLFKLQVMNIGNVTSVALNSAQMPSIIDVYVNEHYKGETLLPKKMFYTDSNNQSKSIDVRIISDFSPKIHGDLWPANNILNKNPYPLNRGSMGGKVYDKSTNEAYFISCYHVVKSPAHNWDFKPNGNEDVLEYQSDSTCGRIVNAVRDDEIDAAIMRAAGDFDIRDGINGIGAPHLVRDLNDNDKRFKTSVKMFGGISQELKTGYVTDINVPAKILYYKDHSTEMEYHRLNKLIFIKSDDALPFSLPGDSGSMVIDEYNYLIGLLVGGAGTRSFVIPINTVFTRLKLKLQLL